MKRPYLIVKSVDLQRKSITLSRTDSPPTEAQAKDATFTAGLWGGAHNWSADGEIQPDGSIVWFVNDT